MEERWKGYDPRGEGFVEKQVISWLNGLIFYLVLLLLNHNY